MPETLTATVAPPAAAYTFVRLELNLEKPLIVAIVRRTVDGVELSGEWRDAQALAMLTALNTADLRANSLVKRVFTQMTAGGFLPAGTVAGAPS